MLMKKVSKKNSEKKTETNNLSLVQYHMFHRLNFEGLKMYTDGLIK